MESNPHNIRWHYSTIGRDDRERKNGHKGVTIWLTGLSASGKSTVACRLEERLFRMGCHAIVLDGDNVRHGLNKNLGFSKEDREENIRRIAELAKLFTSVGIINITAFISPYRADRDGARALQPVGDFVEVYVRCPLEVCEGRDPKGLYKKARAGLISEFTGVSHPYEPPESPEVVLDTDAMTPDECVDGLLGYLHKNGYVSLPETRDYVTIVSGLPRSGTSMMMKMLEAGGLDIVTDNVRKADIDNPGGYYEFEKVKKIKEDSSWLPFTVGRAFKMVSMLLFDLPRVYRYRVVFMEREMSEMVASQEKMLKRLGRDGGTDAAETARLYEKHLARIKGWLGSQPNIDVMYVSFNTMMENPDASARAVAGFIGGLDADRMAAVLDRDLYRNRAGGNAAEAAITQERR